jgi:hypothetical protein
MRGFANAPSGYARSMLTQYREKLKKGQNPHEDRINIIGVFSAPHGWELIERATGITRARISQHFLQTDAFSKCRPVEFGHTSRTEVYPKEEYANPVVWSLPSRSFPRAGSGY